MGYGPLLNSESPCDSESKMKKDHFKNKIILMWLDEVVIRWDSTFKEVFQFHREKCSEGRVLDFFNCFFCASTVVLVIIWKLVGKCKPNTIGAPRVTTSRRRFRWKSSMFVWCLIYIYVGWSRCHSRHVISSLVTIPSLKTFPTEAFTIFCNFRPAKNLEKKTDFFMICTQSRDVS